MYVLNNFRNGITAEYHNTWPKSHRLKYDIINRLQILEKSGVTEM